jgi:hypothetical protein
MPAHIIETKMGMYVKVRDFGLLYGPEIEQKHAKSVTSRFKAHNADLVLMTSWCATCLADNTAVTIDKVNTRAEIMTLAHDLFHELHAAQSDLDDTRLAPKYAINLDDAYLLEDMELHNYMGAFHLGLLERINRNADFARKVQLLEAENGEFLDLIKKSDSESLERQEAARNILKVAHRMDDRLQIIDILLGNFRYSDSSLFSDYLEARCFTPQQISSYVNVQEQLLQPRVLN